MEQVPVVDLSAAEMRRVAHVRYADGSTIVGEIVRISHNRYGDTSVTLKVGPQEFDVDLKQSGMIELEPAA